MDDRRVFVEYAFVRALDAYLPRGALAPVVAFAPQLRTLVLQAAPPAWSPWKRRLLAGEIDAGVARAAGELLGAIRRAGERPALRGRFRHADLFEAQRLDPYFRTAARRAPEAAAPLRALAEGFWQREDLVHGDYSPKNLLTDGSGVQLVDHEVVTRGDAAFDVGFLLTHLALKSIHRPASAAALRAAGESFLDGHRALGATDDSFEERAVAYAGGLLLARVVGKSPAEYLASDGRSRARAVAVAWLRSPPRRWRDAASALS